MKKQHIAIGVIALVILAVVLLLFSTKIALMMSGYNMVKKNADFFPQNKEIQLYVDKVISPEGKLKTVQIRGWAFNPSHQLETEKNIALILKAKNFYYIIPTEIVSRPDVEAHFKDIKLKAEDLGFKGTFSMLALDDGDYELFVKVWEGDQEVSYRSTSRFFNKTKGEFTEIEAKK